MQGRADGHSNCSSTNFDVCYRVIQSKRQIPFQGSFDAVVGAEVYRKLAYALPDYSRSQSRCSTDATNVRLTRKARDAPSKLNVDIAEQRSGA